jgi:hypothetical protein
MLHFCRIEDILAGLTVAPRLQNDLRGVRDTVTQKINTFIRRRLDYQTGVTEYFNSPDLRSGEPFTVWLEKKQLLASSVFVGYSQRSAWDDNILEEERVFLDAEQGKLVIYGPTRQWQRGFRITYDGGFLPLEGDNEVMQCPEGLKFAAVQQCIFEGRRALSGDQGTNVDDDKKTPIRMMGNLLLDVATTFLPYRRPLGR